MINANTRNLIQAISIEGNVADRYFAVTSETPRNTVEARISAMPRNGRSARAGAVRLAGGSSGTGSRGRSSLADAAGGGVTVELGRRKFSNWAMGLKTIIGRDRQAPKTEGRYARLSREPLSNTDFARHPIILPNPAKRDGASHEMKQV